MCGLVWWGGIPIITFSRTKSVIALSSPESEYYGACAVASESLYVKTIVEFLGYAPKIEIQMDASSAIAIGSRHVLGRVRQMDVKNLWLQQLTATRCVSLVKVKGTEHPPYIDTKHLSRKSLAKCARQIGMHPKSAVSHIALGAQAAGRASGARIGVAMLALAGAAATTGPVAKQGSTQVGRNRASTAFREEGSHLP